MQELINELKALQLENGQGFANDYIIANAFKIGQVFHKYNMSKYLKNTKTLSKFILNNFKLEDNRKLYVFASYYLKEIKWLKSVLKTIYKRPDIKFLYNSLYYPEITTAKQIKNKIGCFKYIIHKKPYDRIINVKDNYYCLFDAGYTPHRKFDNLIEHKGKLSSFYLYLTNDFKAKVLNNDFDVINHSNPIHMTSIHLYEHNNGMTLGVFQAEIGQRYLFYVPTTEIEKLYQEAINNYKED